METAVNPFAPPVYNGFEDTSPIGYKDVDFTYPYDVALTALQALRGQPLQINSDADFVWRGLVIAVATGPFTIRILDAQGFALSSAPIAAANILGDAASPYPIFPDWILPAGGQFSIDITDTSGAPNVVQILFRGAKRYRLAG